MEDMKNMTPEEVQDKIVELIQYEYPRLRLETVCDIADVVGEGWEWDEECLPSMEKYVKNGIGIYTKEEFITMDDELYEKAQKQYEDNPDMVMDMYCEDLMDKYQCVAWVDERYKSSEDNRYIEETEPAYIWCD